MGQENIVRDEKQIDYKVLKQIQDHAKKYEYANDKKDFLRKVSAFEHKLILLNSTEPYEVLSYLDELDLKSSRLVLSELTNEEVKSILDKFTSEDKKSFYNHFSDLELVNQFIMNDKNAKEHLEEVSFKRKVEILDSSSKETIESSSKVYDSMTPRQKELADDHLTNVDSITALTNTAEYQKHVEITEKIKENTDNKQNEELKEIENQELKEQQKEELKEEEKKETEKKEIKEELKDEAMKEFYKNRIEFYKQNNLEFKNYDDTLLNDYLNLPQELKLIVDSDYENFKLNDKKAKELENSEKYSVIGNGESKASIVSTLGAKESFKDAVKYCEAKEIINITEKINSKNTNENELNQQPKSL